MEFLEALEIYLTDTRQIHPLARRQAMVLSRSVAGRSLERDARVLLLVNLLALGRGAPRATREYLLQPLKRERVKRYGETYEEENGERPAWDDIITDKTNINYADSLLRSVMENPRRFSPLTGTPPGDEKSRYPLLVIGDSRMGFSQYWDAAQLLEKNLRMRLGETGLTMPETRGAGEIIHSIFGEDSIFPGERRFHERQVTAAALALRTPFLVLSGGPGTGKTSVVIQILRALLRAFPEIEPDRIVLCAPTGRAKARLGESIDEGIGFLAHRMAIREIQKGSRDPDLARLQRKTLHSLLARRPDGTMKYHRGNPLPCQVIVVDEASMVDLSLFAALLEAAAPSCRIILVGDMHQLPSVSAGAVLGDLTERFNDVENFATISGDAGTWLRTVLSDAPRERSGEDPVIRDSAAAEKAGSLMDRVVILTKSYRSSDIILRVSSLVNRGRHEEALEAIQTDETGSIKIDTAGGDGPVRDWLMTHYHAERQERMKGLGDIDPEGINDPEIQGILDCAFAILDESRILTLVHEGKRGRKWINELAAAMVRERTDREPRWGFFHGLPIILNKNLHDLDLYNGDTGMVARSPRGGFMGVFRRGKKYLIYPLDRLTDLEPAYAVTVHKAQGSEFDSVLLVLPDRESPLLTRQVIYTGITRARKKVVILGTEARLASAIQNREERSGGIDI